MDISFTMILCGVKGGSSVRFKCPKSNSERTLHLDRLAFAVLHPRVQGTITTFFKSTGLKFSVSIFISQTAFRPVRVTWGPWHLLVSKFSGLDHWTDHLEAIYSLHPWISFPQMGSYCCVSYLSVRHSMYMSHLLPLIYIFSLT